MVAKLVTIVVITATMEQRDAMFVVIVILARGLIPVKRKTKRRKKMNIQIDYDTWRKILTYAKLSKGEIGGIGDVKVTKDGLKITDAYIFPQTVGSVEVREVDQEEMTEFHIANPTNLSLA